MISKCQTSIWKWSVQRIRSLATRITVHQVWKTIYQRVMQPSTKSFGRRKLTLKTNNQKIFISTSSGDLIWVKKMTTIFNTKTKIINKIMRKVRIISNWLISKNSKIHHIRKKAQITDLEQRKVRIVLFRMTITFWLKKIYTNMKKKKCSQ